MKPESYDSEHDGQKILNRDTNPKSANTVSKRKWASEARNRHNDVPAIQYITQIMDPGDIADRSVEGGDSSGQRWAEFLIHRDSDSIVAIAPHGGQMEPYTDAQPFHVSTSVSNCSAWTFCGYTEEGSARDVYYTTSTAIEPTDYELLPTLSHQQFDLAIAFHGYAPDRKHPEVYVGGTLPVGDRTEVASTIETETGLESTSARPGDGLNDEYGGIAADNILNRLAEDSLQLEQTFAARENHATVCEGVVNSLESVRTE